MAADELNREPGLGSDLLGMRPQVVPKRLGLTRIVKQSDVAPREIARQRGRSPAAYHGDDTVEAGEHTDNFLLMSLHKRIHGRLHPAGRHRHRTKELNRLPPPVLTTPSDSGIPPGLPTCLVPAPPG